MSFNLFDVTDMGLQINGKMIMPGSKLVIKGGPHPSWNGCGKVQGQVSERVLVVASPETASEETLRAKYERVTGKKPHHKAKDETIQAELSALEADE